MDKRVRKRTGQLQEFDPKRIRKVILMAFNDVHTGSGVPELQEMTDRVVDALTFDDSGIIDIEEVQDTVVAVIDGVDSLVATHFKTYREERAQLRAVRQSPDKSAPADYIHFAKYARYQYSEGRRELYHETVRRVKEMHMKRFQHLGSNFIGEIAETFEFVYNKEVLPSMRSMQFGGAACEVNNARMYNCAFTLVDRPRCFAEIFWLLLSGCGVGYSVQWCHVEKLPDLGFISEKKVIHHVIADTIEGWADAITFLFSSYSTGFCAEFSYHLIRSEGAPLRTTGGLAPGHIPLRKAIENIRSVLHKSQGRGLRPLECHDIICFLAEAVLAGGIRRSSLIAVFSPEDTEMLFCKTSGVFNPFSGLNGQREMANNSAAFIRRTVQRKDFDRVIKLSQQYYGDPSFYFTDHPDYGTNPCGEIGLHPVIDGETGFSFCNLSTINMASITDEAHYFRAAKAAAFIGTLQASYTDFPYLRPVSKKIAMRDALIGVSMTGMMDRPKLAFDTTCQRQASMQVLVENRRVARIIGVNFAERCTTIKPEGTSSWEVGGVGSGIHSRHARRFFRRFTANPMEPVAIYFKKYNPHMVENKPNGDWSIVFPIQCEEEAITVKDLGALEFMDKVFSTYENWVRPGSVSSRSPGLTHNVSCTVTVRDEEVQAVMERVWENRNRIAAMAFAPHSLDKKFPYAPNEAVETEADEAKWNYLIKNYVKVPWDLMKEEPNSIYRDALEPACGPQGCEVPERK